MLFPQILHFIGMGALGAFLAVLVWAKEVKELYSFDSLKSVCIGAIVGYLYSLLYENYSFPDLIIGNTVYDCVLGIGVAPACNHVDVIGNVVRRIQRYGILVATWGGMIVGNYVRAVSLASGGGYNAIEIASSSHVVVGNHVLGDNEAGSPMANYLIYEQDDADWNVITNNRLQIWVTGGVRKVGPNTIAKNNAGYFTENFKVTGVSVSVGTGGAYGSAVNITSLSGVITYPRVKITWGGTFGSGETVTVQITAVYTDSSTVSITKSATATGSTWLTDDDIEALIAQGKDITRLQVSASSNLSSTSVTVTVDAYGKA